MAELIGERIPGAKPRVEFPPGRHNSHGEKVGVVDGEVNWPEVEQADEIMRNLGLTVALPKGAVRMAHLLEVQRFARETENGYKILASLGLSLIR